MSEKTHKFRKVELSLDTKAEPKLESKQDEKPKVRKSNKWIDHVRKYAKDNNVSYKAAIISAKASYTKNV